MATKDQQPDGAANIQRTEKGPPLYTLEELRKKKNVSPCAFCGMCAQQGWRPGKAVTEGEFDAAEIQFMKGGGGNAERR